MSASSPWVLLPWLGLTVGLAVLVLVGFRGRRVATAGPVCGRCGYDLSGRAADLGRCSECGSDLGVPGAVVRYRRTRGMLLATAAGALFVPAAFYTVMAFANYDWDGWLLPRSSVDRLLYRAAGAPGATGDRYREELLRRRDASALPPADAERFHDHLLGLQADLNTPWRTRWGDVLRRAWEDGAMDEARRRRFFSQMFPVPGVRVRSPLRVGDPLLLSLDATARWGSGRKQHDVKWWVAARVGGPAEIRDALWSAGTPSNAPSRRTLRPEEWGGDAVKPGRHTLHVRTARQLIDNVTSMKPLSERVESEHRVEIDVLPAGTAIGQPFDDPAAGPVIAGATQVGVYRWRDGRIFATVRLLKAPVDRAFHVLVREGDKDRPIGLVAGSVNEWGWGDLSMYVGPPDDRLEKLTLVLQSDSDALAGTENQQRYWRGRIVFPDVPVQPEAQFYPLINGPDVPTNTPYVIEPLP